MAELFSEAAYATGMFGKWHLGNTPGRFPTDQGFDEWFGIPDPTDEVLYPESDYYDPSETHASSIYDARKGDAAIELKTYSLEDRPLIDGIITDRTIEFIERQA